MIKCEKCFYYGKEHALPHCGNLAIDNEDYEPEHFCLAFPYGIPADIVNGAEHNDVRPDQEGDLIFEPKE